MDIEEKRALILLHAVIFYFHGFDPEEEVLLNELVAKLDGESEKKWSLAFIEKYFGNHFEKARKIFRETFIKLPKSKRLEYLELIWIANAKKGFTTEMEAVSMFKLAKDWDIETELMSIVKS